MVGTVDFGPVNEEFAFCYKGVYGTDLRERAPEA